MCTSNMGNSASKKPKINKNHNREKVVKIGVSVERDDLNLEGHLQMGYNSKTIKNYTPIENASQETNSTENEESTLQNVKE